MERKFYFKKGVLKFAAIASALAFTIGQFGGYTLTAFAGDDPAYTIKDGTLTITGDITAEGVLDALTKEGDYGSVTKVVIESGATVGEDTFKDNTKITSIENNTGTELTLPSDSSKDSIWKTADSEEEATNAGKGTTSKAYRVTYNVEGKDVDGGYVTVGDAISKIDGYDTVTTWYDANGNEYSLDTPITGKITLYSTKPVKNSETATSAVITITTGTSDDDDDDDTDTTTETTVAATEATSVTVSGTNSTAVANKIKDVAAGSTVTVDMSSNKTVAKNVLEAAKGKNVDVVLDMGDYKWTINGASIGSDVHNVNMGVTFAADDIPQDEISEVAGDDSYKTISLDYDGEFGFTGFLSFGVGSENAGKYVNLYYFNADKQLEYQNSGIVDKDGNTSLSFSHASEYVAVISDTKASAATAVKTTSATSPVTADSATAVPFILLIVAAAAMFAATAYKKRDI
jgi:hypothetical protein